MRSADAAAFKRAAVEMLTLDHLPETANGPRKKKNFPLTDAGNGERIAERYCNEVRYCYPMKSWFVFDGRRWTADVTGEMLQRTKVVARSLYDEAAHLEDSETRRRVSDWARKCESADRLRAALFCAQSEKGIPVLPEDFDCDPFLLNCQNGVVDLRTGLLRKHHSGDMISRIAPVVFDARAQSELWDKFLREITSGDAELQRFLQLAAGYSLSGSVAEEVLFFVHGPGGSGKSTFLEALKSAFGDYAKVADFESFISRRDAGQIRNDIAELVGRRFVVSIEVEEGKKLAEGLVKMLTGGDTVRARFLYQEAFDFLPSFKLWLAANSAPKVRDSDSAMWRRILRLPFEAVVPKADRDPSVKLRLKDATLSGPAVLAWAVQGCLEWQKSGLQIPGCVERATEEYRLSQDPLRDFLSEYCSLSPDDWTATDVLRRSYEEWASDLGERHPLGRQTFNERLIAAGCEQKKLAGRRGWAGIGLLKDHA